MEESTKNANPPTYKNWEDMSDNEQIQSVKDVLTSAATNESVRNEVLNPATAKGAMAREGKVIFNKDVVVRFFETKDAAKREIWLRLPEGPEQVDTTKQWLCTYVKYPPVSSARFKDEIKRMDTASEAVFDLKPVTFRYKQELDPDRSPQFGLVAEEVEKVDPDLVVHDDKGRAYGVRYDAVSAMLLNEFLKEHRIVQEQAATIAQLQRRLESVITSLNEQGSQIQRINAKLEVTKSATMVT
jgi:hypothetical protein